MGGESAAAPPHCDKILLTSDDKKILNKNNCPEYLPRIGLSLSLSHTFLTRNEVAEFLVTYCVADWDVAQDMERN